MSEAVQAAPNRPRGINSNLRPEHLNAVARCSTARHAIHTSLLYIVVGLWQASAFLFQPAFTASIHIDSDARTRWLFPPDSRHYRGTMVTEGAMAGKNA